MTTTAPVHSPEAPWAIALLRLPSGCQSYEVSRRDMEADTAWAISVYRWMGLEKGKPIQLIGAGSENALLWPFEDACIRLGIPFGMGEPVQIDSGRTDMFLRRFQMQAVIGLAPGILDGLQAAGRDLGLLLGASPVLACVPGACARIEAAGLRAWRMVQLGPMYAFAAPGDSHLRYDTGEWLVEEHDRQLLLTSVGPRATAFARLATGVRGEVATRTADGKAERVFTLLEG